MNDYFNKMYIGTFSINEEYEHYLELWTEYRKQTNHLSAAQGKEAWRIYKRLFNNLPKNQYYDKAREASLRVHQ